jgi:hypothetical protein
MVYFLFNEKDNSFNCGPRDTPFPEFMKAETYEIEIDADDGANWKDGRSVSVSERKNISFTEFDKSAGKLVDLSSSMVSLKSQEGENWLVEKLTEATLLSVDDPTIMDKIIPMAVRFLGQDRVDEIVADNFIDADEAAEILDFIDDGQQNQSVEIIESEDPNFDNRIITAAANLTKDSIYANTFEEKGNAANIMLRTNTTSRVKRANTFYTTDETVKREI